MARDNQQPDEKSRIIGFLLLFDHMNVVHTLDSSANFGPVICVHSMRRLNTNRCFFLAACFAAGVYIGLHFTILAEKEEEGQPFEGRNSADFDGGDDDSDDGSAHPAYAVLCLFPIVAGIFLIFIW